MELDPVFFMLHELEDFFNLLWFESLHILRGLFWGTMWQRLLLSSTPSGRSYNELRSHASYGRIDNWIIRKLPTLNVLCRDSALSCFCHRAPWVNVHWRILLCVLCWCRYLGLAASCACLKYMEFTLNVHFAPQSLRVCLKSLRGAYAKSRHLQRNLIVRVSRVQLIDLTCCLNSIAMSWFMFEECALSGVARQNSFFSLLREYSKPFCTGLFKSSWTFL